MDQKIKNRLEELTKKEIIHLILERLKSDLSSDLYYHSSFHTEDVIKEVITFALHDGLGDREVELLAIAAAYHDAGFLAQREQNEPIGAKYAETAMKESAQYSEDETAQVVQMIFATELMETPLGAKRVPKSELSKYLLDADLSSLGRNDLFVKTRQLQKELSVANYDEFIKTTLKLMEDHAWFTPAAKELRDEVKQINILKIKEFLGESICVLV